MRIFEFEKGGGKENKDGIILLSLMKLNYVTKYGNEKFFFYEGYYIFFNEQRSLRNEFLCNQLERHRLERRWTGGGYI